MSKKIESYQIANKLAYSNNARSLLTLAQQQAVSFLLSIEI